MSETTIACGGKPLITLKVAGDLRIEGWGRNEILLKSKDPKDVHVQHEGDRVEITSDADCEVSVPSLAIVNVEHVGGDGEAYDLQGNLRVVKVEGDLTLHHIGGAFLERIGGDLMAKHVKGDLNVQHVGGDARIKDVMGVASVITVGGDLSLEDGSGGQQTTVGGDARVGLKPRAGQDYTLRAGGDITIVLPMDASLRADIHSGSGVMEISLGSRIEHIEAHTYQLTLGKGEASLSLLAGGEVTLTSESRPAWTGDEFLAGFAQELSSLGERISRKVSTSVRSAEFNERVDRVLDQALRRMQYQVNSAMKRVEEKLTGSESTQAAPASANAGVATPIKEVEVPAPAVEGTNEKGQVSPPAAKPTGEDERLQVLRMLQEKKITAEEAELLLEALDAQDEA
jgi:hypothetical protein